MYPKSYGNHYCKIINKNLKLHIVNRLISIAGMLEESIIEYYEVENDNIAVFKIGELQIITTNSKVYPYDEIIFNIGEL
jgi:hypothetical protein